MACRVVHAGQLTDSFMVKTGVRQGCRLSSFLFLLAIDWIMRLTNIEEMGCSGHHGASWRTWTLRMTSLSSHTAINRCRKNRAAQHSFNTARTQRQQKQSKDYESQHKEQQGSTINNNEITEEEVKSRIQKARVAFVMLRKIRRAKQI